jgi:hypothetical protein
VRDAIRIVPLRLEGEPPAPAAAPELTYRGGPLLTSVEAVALYWGVQWRTEPLLSLSRRLDAFLDYVLSSPLLDQLGEYSVEGKTIGHGRRVLSTTLDAVPTSAVLEDAQLRDALRGELQALPPRNANTLYVIFLPPGTTVAMGGSRSCQAFCGYHDAIDDEIFYALLPYPGCAGCLGGADDFDALTSTVSHELAEAVTDPVPGTGWYDDAHGEVGDICAWETKQLGGYAVQLEWSNAQGRCV